MIEDRRKSPRIPFREAVEIQSSDESPLGSLSRDLSKSGMGIQSFSFFPLNADIALNFRLNDSNVVEMQGNVIWVRQIPYSESYYLGVQFSDNESAFYPKEKIGSFIQTQLH